MTHGHVRIKIVFVMMVIQALLTATNPEQASGAANTQFSRHLGLTSLPHRPCCDKARDRTSINPKLPALPEAQAAQVRGWHDHGIVFQGPWRPDELALVLQVLDTYRARMGEQRFIDLVHGALDHSSPQSTAHLTFVKKERSGVPTAGWLSHAGQVVVNDSLFDWAVIHDHYPWVYPATCCERVDREALIQHVTVAHEVGHVIADGLRAELHDIDADAETLEELYTRHVKKYAWPHPTSSANENLATEIALWALGAERHDEVVTFQVAYLVPAMAAQR